MTVSNLLDDIEPSTDPLLVRADMLYFYYNGYASFAICTKPWVCPVCDKLIAANDVHYHEPEQ